jgi:hypothetical protein
LIDDDGEPVDSCGAESELVIDEDSASVDVIVTF